MRIIENIKKAFFNKTVTIFLLIVLAAAAVFGGLSLTGENNTRTAHADTVLSNAELSSLGYSYQTYATIGNPSNAYYNGSSSMYTGNGKMLYTSTGLLLAWYYTSMNTTLRFGMVYSATSTTSWPGAAKGGIMADTDGRWGPVVNYAGCGGVCPEQNPNITSNIKLYFFCPTLYKDANGYVYGKVNGTTYYFGSATGSYAPSTSKPSTAPLITKVSSSVQAAVTSPLSLTYTGSSQTHPGAYAYSSYFTFTGATSATNVGRYNYTVTPKSGYAWSDGSTGSKTVTWTITQADGTPVLNAPSKIVANGTDTLAVTTKSTGAVSYTSSDSAAVSVSGTGKVATLTGGNKLGAATVTVAVAADANYKAGIKTVQVTNCLENGFYIVKSDGGKYAYDSLKAAYADLGDSTDQTIYVIGNPTVDEPLVVQAGDEVRIAAGDSAVSMTAPNNAVISRAEGVTDSIFTVEGGGTLSIEGITLDGDGVTGDSLIKSAGSLTIGDGATVENGNATNGGAVYVSGGTLTVADGASFTGNTATNGGAVYVAGGTATVNGSFTGNTAGGDGGAIYIAKDVADGVSVGTQAKIANNAAEGTGSGIHIEDGVRLLLAGNATGVTDGIGIEGAGKIALTGSEVTGRFVVDFDDPENQLAEHRSDNAYLLDYANSNRYVVAENSAISNGELNSHVSVQNGGYVFDYDKSTADPVAGLCLKVSKTNVVAYKESDGTITYFSSIKEAIAHVKEKDVPGTLYFLQHETQNDDGSKSYSHVFISLAMTVPAGVNITYESAVMVPTGEVDATTGEVKEEIRFLTPNEQGKLTDEEGNVYSPTVIQRAQTLTGALLTVEEGGSLTLGNVTLDGGAVWSGGSIQISDDGKGGAGTVTTNNTGVTAHAPVIVNKGTLNIADGATVQNNDNNYAKPGEGFGSQNYGGGVRNEGAGKLTMTGGTIQNCYSREGGAIMNVNKPGTEAYAENDSPSVTVSGGTIAGNVSQQKGAAIQTIYGGATTTVTGKAEITDNRSLNDLGVLAVEEGGSLIVSGGTVSADDETRNVIYLYNKYSEKDYTNAATKPFIEGKGVAELAITGNPALTGGVHIDDACYVVNTDNQTYYEPVIDITGYTGAGINVDLNEGAPYGKVAVSGANDFSGLAFGNNTSGEDGLNAVFTYATQEEDGSYALRTSGYTLEIDQTVPGKLKISGACDCAIEGVTFTIGGETYTLSKGNGIDDEGNILYEFDLSDLDGADFMADISVTIGGASVYDQTDRVSLAVVKFDSATGKITAPGNTAYTTSDGTEKALKSGTLPNDIIVDDSGNITVTVDGKERTVHIGTRADNVVSDIQTYLYDIADTTMVIVPDEQDKVLEYNLVYVDGEGNKIPVSADWMKPDKEGKVEFTGLTAGVEYSVVVRNPAATDAQGEVVSIPGEYVECADSVYTTLTGTQIDDKIAFEEAYERIKDRLIGEDESGMPTDPTASTEEIKEVVDLSDNLTDDVRAISAIKIKIAHLQESYGNVLAKAWLTDHAQAIEAVKNAAEGEDLSADKDGIGAALDAYEADSFTDSARSLVEQEYNALKGAYVDIVVARLEAVKEEAGSDEITAVIEDYIALIRSAATRTETDLLALRAAAAADYLESYAVLKGGKADMTDGDVAKVLTGIGQAESLTDINRALQAGVLDLIDGEWSPVGDSQETKAKISEGKENIVSATDAANAAERVADLSTVVATLKSAVDDLREGEKSAAIGEIDGDEDIAAIKTALSDDAAAEADELIDAAKSEIVNGEYDDYPAIIAKLKTKLSVLRIYDDILTDHADGISEDGRTELRNLLNESYTQIDGAEANENSSLTDVLSDIVADAEIGLHKIKAEELIKDHYNDILADCAELGISAPETDGLKTVCDQAVADIGKATDVGELDGIVENYKLKLDREEAITVLQNYVRDDTEEIRAIIGAEAGDGTQASGPIADILSAGTKEAVDSIVSDTILSVEKARAKDAVNAALNQYPSSDTVVAEAGGYTAQGGIIDGQTTVEGVRAKADRMIAVIKIEHARAELHREIDSYPGDKNAADKKQAVDAVLNQALASIESKAQIGADGLPAETADYIAEAEEAASGAAGRLDAFDREKFIGANKAILDRQLADITAGDLSAIDAALDDLAQNYIVPSRNKMDDLRDDLLNKKKAALISALEAEKGKDGAVNDVLSSYIDAIRDQSVNGDTEADGEVNANLTLLYEKAVVAKDYLEKYNEIYGREADLTDSMIVDALDRIYAASDLTEVNGVLDECVTALAGERYLDDNPVLRKRFSDVGSGDEAALKSALEAAGNLPDNVIGYLDGIAEDAGYSGFESFVGDRIKKSAFEGEREEILAATRAFVKEHDGEYVKDILAERLDAIRDVAYEPYYDDAGRDGYADEKSKELQTALQDAKKEIEHAQAQQRAVNQAVQVMQDLLTDSGYEYSQEQAEYLQKIIDELTEDIKEVPSSATDCQTVIEELLNKAKEKLGDAPVKSVVKGDLVPSDSSADYGEDHDGNEIWGIVTNDSGMEGSVVLVIEKVEEDREEKINAALKDGDLVAAEGSDISEEELQTLIDGKEVKSTIDIYLLKNNVKITEFNGLYVVKILLDSEMRSMSGLQVVYIEDDGGVQVYRTDIEDEKYLVFTTSHFSEFIIVGEPELNLWWLIITLSVLFAIELIAIAAVLIGRKKREEAVKASMFVPVGSLLTIVIPNGAVAACVALGACIVAAGTVLAVLALKKQHAEKERVPEDAPGEADEGQTRKVIPSEIAVAASAVGVAEAVHSAGSADLKIRAEEEEPESETVYDPVTHRYIVIKYSKSFLAKLIQSDDETKSYYAALKNEIMSYGVKSRISWRHESFRYGNALLMKMQMRGKTLCLCFALSASDYAESKYKVEDYSEVTALKATPCLYRIKNIRRYRYAKDLIADVMKKYGPERGEEQNVSYASQLPYENTDELVSKGLIKVLTDEEAQSGTRFRPVEVRHEVKATEVDGILSDAAAKALVESSVRYADKTRTGIINVDTISQCFQDGATVTLDDIKRRVPGFNRKITYVKVLARGILDKSLTVEADDFSIEAVKMILLTGGKVVRTRRKNEE